MNGEDDTMDKAGENGFHAAAADDRTRNLALLQPRDSFARRHLGPRPADIPAMLETVGHPTVVNPDRGLRKEAAARGWPVQTFSRPVPLRDRLPAPSGAAMATTAAVGLSALAAGALTYSLTHSLLRRLSD